MGCDIRVIVWSYVREDARQTGILSDQSGVSVAARFLHNTRTLFFIGGWIRPLASVPLRTSVLSSVCRRKHGMIGISRVDDGHQWILSAYPRVLKTYQLTPRRRAAQKAAGSVTALMPDRPKYVQITQTGRSTTLVRPQLCCSSQAGARRITPPSC